jgi:hypothetical protein
MTVRQVFYRLVGSHGYEKTDNAYARLIEMLNRARRAQLIDMDAIRDDGGNRVEPQHWRDAEHLLDACRHTAKTFRLDRQEGQETRLVVMCEAAGMVPQLAHAVEPYGVPVYSSGGFDSVTEKHRLAREWSDHAEPVEVLHIGDHDPSGVHIFLALSEDIKAFGDAYLLDVSFTRLAVTPDQITSLGLDTAPAKSGRLAFNGETCQAEAIAPDVLVQIVQDAITARLDRDAYDDVLDRENDIRDELADKLA